MRFFRTLIFFLVTTIVSVAASSFELPKLDTTANSIARGDVYDQPGSPIQLFGYVNGRFVMGPRFKLQGKIIKWELRIGAVVISAGLLRWVSKEVYERMSSWRSQLLEWRDEEEEDSDRGSQKAVLSE